MNSSEYKSIALAIFTSFSVTPSAPRMASHFEFVVDVGPFEMVVHLLREERHAVDEAAGAVDGLVENARISSTGYRGR
jgi:hypothetical protein